MIQFETWQVENTCERPHKYTRTNTGVCDTLKSRMGNWSVEVGASGVSRPQGSGLLMHASLDHREKIWLNGTVAGRCLHSTAGYRNGKWPPRMSAVRNIGNRKERV